MTENTMKLKRWMMDARVVVGMVVVQLILTGQQILSRVILSDDTFIFALITYRHLVAAFSIAPFALYFERGALRKINFEALIWLFIVALVGILMALGLFYYGLRDTTATYASNFLTLVPVITFLFSTILRIEDLSVGGKSKCMGAIVCLAGALTMVLYEGKSFNLIHHNRHQIIIKTDQHKARGTLFLIASVISYSFWFILQVKLFKIFPHKCCATLAVCVLASVQGAVIGLCIDTKPNSWRLGWNLQLLTIFYSGVLATGATFALVLVAITQKGPTYPSMFNPLSLFLVLLIEHIFLHQDLYVGSLIGMTLIIAGLYTFLWGRNQEIKESSARGGGEDVEAITATISATCH